MNLLILENDLLAAESLQLLIKKFDSSMKVRACLNSIEVSVKWLQTNPMPDLILADIQLSDGSSFDIFKKVNIHKPVIFTTASDNFALEAFRLFTIDYILKPVTLESLAAAFNKYKSMPAAFFNSDYSPQNIAPKEKFNNKYRNRFLAKIGQRSFFIKSKDIVCFIADNKIVTLVDEKGSHYNINFTMEKLETILDPDNFFRLNRKVIVNIDAIEHIKPYFNNRLKIFVKGVNADEEMVVSRERVADFKAWAEN